MAITYLSKIPKKKLTGTAIVRVDFNGGLFRLEKAINTFKYLEKYADKIVVIGHKGRPTLPLNKKEKEELSLEFETKNLSRLLGGKVIFLDSIKLSENGNDIRRAPKKSIILLENLRFIKGEMENDEETGRILASLGDYYVNEAFAASHRENSSVCAMTKYIKSYAGFNFEEEIKNLSLVLKKAKKPIVLIFGGAKITSKTPVIMKFYNKADNILIGGALANTLLYLSGVKIGNSLAEKHVDSAVLRLLQMDKIHIPSDLRKSGNKILDIGPKTEVEFKNYIKGAKTIIWNGPIGMFEKKGFEIGTKSIAKVIADTKAFTVVGGGETIEAIRKFKLEKKYDFVSTGGGAMLEFLAGNKLPGVKALEK